MYNLFSFFLPLFVLNLSDLMGIFHLQRISIQNSHISSTQLLYVACGYCHLGGGGHQCSTEVLQLVERNLDLIL